MLVDYKLSKNREKKGNSIEELVLLIEEAFNTTKVKDLASTVKEEIKKVEEKTEKEGIVVSDKKETMSYTISKFANDYKVNTTGKSPYVPEATYNYSVDFESNVFTPQLQTYYIQERKKEGESKTKTNFQVITYNDVKERHRVAKMNVNSTNNYVDPRMELEYKYWSLFSFNFIISGLVYNHIGS